MKLVVLSIGGQKEAWLQELVSSYQKKLRHLIDFEVMQLKPVKLDRGSAEQKKDAESQALLNSLKADDYVILCDERGEPVDSKGFSKKLVRSIESGRKRVVIVIGGAFGSAPSLQKRADWVWSLSPLVFNHLLAQALVLEQVYRGFSIAKNLPYHNE